MSTTKIIDGPAMQFQYDNAIEDESENTASGLCNAVLHALFPRQTFIITGQYRFKTKLIADYVVERVWNNGARATILVVEVKPAGQSAAQDAKADDQVRQYARSVLAAVSTQKKVYTWRWVGGEVMMHFVTRQNQNLQPFLSDYADLEDDYSTIQDATGKIGTANVFI